MEEQDEEHRKAKGAFLHVQKMAQREAIYGQAMQHASISFDVLCTHSTQKKFLSQRSSLQMFYILTPSPAHQQMA